jgi:hypothetical protein
MYYQPCIPEEHHRKVMRGKEKEKKLKIETLENARRRKTKSARSPRGKNGKVGEKHEALQRRNKTAAAMMTKEKKNSSADRGRSRLTLSLSQRGLCQN